MCLFCMFFFNFCLFSNLKMTTFDSFCSSLSFQILILNSLENLMFSFIIKKNVYFPAQNKYFNICSQ